jgi:hypothetical protein
MSTHSISVRLRRVVTEEAHVSVPVTPALMTETPEPDGTFRLRPGAVFSEAQRLGREDAGLVWRADGEVEVSVHPVQAPPPGSGLEP